MTGKPAILAIPPAPTAVPEKQRTFVVGARSSAVHVTALISRLICQCRVLSGCSLGRWQVGQVQRLMRRLAVSGLLGIQSAGECAFGERDIVGLVAMPCGFVEPNEKPVETIVREVREETGLEVAIKQLVGVFTRLPNHDKYARAAYAMWKSEQLLPAISD